MVKATKKAAEATEWYQRHDNDTGSPEYQIVQMTDKITLLQGHLATNAKDFDAKRSLLKLVAKRRQFLKYLKQHELERYTLTSKKLDLKV